MVTLVAIGLSSWFFWAFSDQSLFDRALESRVEVVQCPMCGLVSKAKLKGQSVVIVSHPPRKVHAVRNVTCWVEQETEWVLVQKKE